MEKLDMMFDAWSREVCELGAKNARVIPTNAIELEASFRDLCSSNACGVYGKCWMCPPDIGPIDELMAEVRKYDHALVYQSVSELEDSFDFEGMTRAKKKHARLTQKIRENFDGVGLRKVLHLSTGGCGVCAVCAKRTNQPCRFPALAVSSLEAYGINVSRLAAAADMKYINGVNTVTYFGVILFSLNKDGD